MYDKTNNKAKCFNTKNYLGGERSKHVLQNIWLQKLQKCV